MPDPKQRDSGHQTEGLNKNPPEGASAGQESRGTQQRQQEQQQKDKFDPQRQGAGGQMDPRELQQSHRVDRSPQQGNRDHHKGDR